MANVAALHRGAGDVYHISTGIPVTVNELFRKIAILTDYKLEPNYGPRRKGDVLTTTSHTPDARDWSHVAREVRKGDGVTLYWWVVALAWQDNPFLGPVIADGAGDHSVKVWDADGAGGTTCKPGQFRVGGKPIELPAEAAHLADRRAAS